MFLLMSYFVLVNVYWTFNLKTVFCLFETLILVIFDLIFALKPPNFLKNLRISLKKKKNWNLGWFQWNPSKGFKFLKKTTIFQKYGSISSKKYPNVVEFYSDIVGYFPKKVVFLKPLSCSKTPRYVLVTIKKLNKIC